MYSFKRDGQSWVSHLHIPLESGGRGRYVPLRVTPEIAEPLLRFRKLFLRRHELGDELDALKQDIKDTTNIEKKVLAALTKRTITADPTLLNQVRQIAADLSPGSLLLTDNEAT